MIDGDRMRPDVATVVGLATEEQWGQTLQTPQAYGVVEMYAADGIARTRGVSVLTELTKLFDEPPLSLRELTQAADTMMADDVVSLIVMIPVGSTLYVVSRGKGSVYLKRGNKLARLLSGVQSLSGAIQPDDTLILASAGFDAALTPSDIMGVFDHLSPSEVAEKLTIKLHEHDTGQGGVALIYRVPPLPEPVKDDEPEAKPREAPVSRTILVSRAKSVGRRFLTPRQRVAVRTLITRLLGVRSVGWPKLVAILVVILFLISVILGVRRQAYLAATSNLTETLTQAEHSFEEGMALLDLNPVKGRERLTAARDLLAPIVSRKLRTAEGRRAEAMLTEVTESLTRSMRVTQVKPELFFDMALLKKGGIASDVSLFEETFGILDTKTSAAYTLGTTVKNGEIVGGGKELTGASQIAAYGDKLYLYSANGIHELRLTDGKVTANKVPVSSEWGTVTDLSAFGGNLYLLDTQKSRIWKYVATEKGFSDTYEYLNPDTLPDLSKATGLSIDGSVWIGTTDGRILRFSAGRENSFVTSGTDKPLGSRLTVYASDTDKHLYVLDSDNRRAVVFDKDGLYLSQYVWDEEFSPTALFAAEKAGKLFLVRDGKIYSVALK